MAASLAAFWQGLSLWRLGLVLLLAVLVVRGVFYVLRRSFASAPWLRPVERLFLLLVVGTLVLHVTDLLPWLIDALDGVALHVGKSRLSLWLLLQGVVVLAVTLLAALWAGNAIEARLNRAASLDDNLRVVLARLSKAALLLIAVLVALPLVGIDLTTLSVFGGALGVGLGFGLQKIASNYVSGFIILLDRSIRIGNMISVGSDRGEVTRITTRYTVLRNVMGVEALVPNELLVGSVVQSESYSDPRVRIALHVQVAYDCDLERALRLLEEVALTHPRVLRSPAPQTLVLAFADSGINLELGIWINDPQEGTGSLRSDINLGIWRALRAAGIAIPFPQREVRLLQDPPHV